MGCFNGSLYIFPFTRSMGKKWTLEVLLIEFRNQTVSIFFYRSFCSGNTFFLIWLFHFQNEIWKIFLFRNPKKFPWTSRSSVNCSINYFFVRMLTIRLLDFLIFYYIINIPLFFHWFESFFQWISEFILKRIGNLGIRIVK